MILCAAIKARFLRNDRPVDVVIPGLRHGNCSDLMSNLLVPLQRDA